MHSRGPSSKHNVSRAAAYQMKRTRQRRLIGKHSKEREEGRGAAQAQAQEAAPSPTRGMGKMGTKGKTAVAVERGKVENGSRLRHHLLLQRVFRLQLGRRMATHQALNPVMTGVRSPPPPMPRMTAMRRRMTAQ